MAHPTPDPEWIRDAPCRGKADLFFPEGQPGRQPPDRYAKALAICATCPFKAPCRAWAEDAGEIVDGVAMYGVVAGLAPPSNRPNRPHRAAMKVGTPTTCQRCGVEFLRAKGLYGYCSMACRWKRQAATEHGTDARYRKHLRDGDTPCQPCRDEHARYAAMWNTQQHRRRAQ